ncbi:hypothetical protein [Actinobacillus minor]|uniref:hypothetical protein n=1 Tax=Actinobacillus minor TaxID=51047 RepID=UPI0026EAAD57|nr:hypothetical protein [Actinobacillus minor]
MKKLGKLSALVAAAVMATGCATIVSDSKYNVSIQSNPSGASFVIKNRAGNIVQTGTTPQNVILEAGAGYFKGEKYQITFTPKGKNTKPQTFELDTKLDGWYLGGNLLFGGLVGYLIVDPLSGAMYKLPEYFLADLGGEKTGLHIISTEMLTAEQRSKLVPVNL